MKTLAWKSDPKLKKSFINRLEAHRKAEELVQGVGFEKNGQVKGCNIGCLFDYYDHTKGAEESGIPEVLLRLADKLFEGLPVKKANDFAIEWPKAIKPGVDLSKVKWKFCAFILKENIERVLLLKIDDKLKEQVVNAIQGILKLHEKAVISGQIDESAWSVAESAAWSAESAAESAESAAWSAESAAWSAKSATKSATWSAESAAWSVAESAAWSAESAAWSAESAAWSAAESAESAAWSVAESAKSAAYSRYAKEFIRLLSEAE